MSTIVDNIVDSSWVQEHCAYEDVVVEADAIRVDGYLQSLIILGSFLVF